MRLTETDRNLPQIKLISKYLVKGFALHHAGLMPIVKEMVEILFSDGYLKIIFATTTFSIGLNLPARSVLFTDLRKFNGVDLQFILSSEYL